MSDKCVICGKKPNFFTEFQCRGCGKLFCSDHIHKVKQQYDEKVYGELKVDIPDFEFSFTKFSSVACEECLKKYNHMNAIINYAFDHYHEVKSYSRNYRGKISCSDQNQLKIETYFYKDKAFAETMLLTKAYFLGYNIVYSMYYDRDTESTSSDNGKGTYHYSVFRYLELPPLNRTLQILQ